MGRDIGDVMKSSGAAAVVALPRKKRENARATPVERGPQGTLAEEIAKVHRDDLRYCWPWKMWFAFDGKRWREHGDDLAHSAMRDVALHYYGLAADERNDAERKRLAKLAELADAAKGRRDVLVLTQAEPGMSIAPDAFDRDPWLLNVANGTVELQTGRFREHRAIDYQRKLSPVSYDATATAPTWIAFLERIMDGNLDLIGYLQRLAGYCATGVIREHVLPIFWGSGRNGKGTFIAALQYVLGEYARALPEGMLLARRNDQHPAELMTLFGTRFATSQEIKRRAELNEARVKALTGGDRFSARGMHKDFIDFDPTHKLVLVTNHRPVVKEQTPAMWERLALVPFDVTIPAEERDDKLGDKLRAEASGILNWIIDGCIEWQREGLNPPDAVRAATADYRAASDLLRQFIDDRCSIDPALTCQKSVLHAAFNDWARREGHEEMTSSEFHEVMVERRFAEARTKKQRFWKGIALQQDGDW